MLHYKILFSYLLTALFAEVMGQSVPLSPLSLHNDLRVLQLQGKLDPQYSFTVQPVTPGKRFSYDSLYSWISNDNDGLLKTTSAENPTTFFQASFLPVSLTTKFTTHHPYGWSDGALAPMHGIQGLVSAGGFLRAGPLSLQFLPEFLYASNHEYEFTPAFGNSAPERNHQRLLAGQSKLALTVGPISAALSSENISWGPGQFTNLIMGNNAPGFYHLSFSTKRPLKTPIGSFEWQVIAGKLEDEAEQSEEAYRLKSNKEIFGTSDKLNWKYLSAIVFSYQPAFLRTLTIGLSRSFMTDQVNLENGRFGNESIIRQYLPVFDKIFKSKLTNEDQRPWNQLASVYMRILFPKAHTETYFEYGWNDHKYNLRDMLMSPFHSAAYIAGAKKMVPLEKNKWLDFAIEINQMEESPDYLVRSAGSWYLHGQNSNYANFGQVLGSGIGYGSNSLIASATLRKGFQQIGLIFEKTQKNPNENTIRWTDFSLGITGRKKWKNLILSGRLHGIQSTNYGWIQDKDRFQIMGILSMMYVL